MPKSIIITGSTGSGKSDLALMLALEFKGEIINADSLAFYKYLDIGTAKPSLKDRALVPHHLIDILTPDEHFDAATFVGFAQNSIKEIHLRSSLPFIVGGTGLYLTALVQGIFEGPKKDEAFRANLKEQEKNGVNLYELLKAQDPLSAERLFPHDRVRIERALEVLYLTGESIVTWQKRHRDSLKNIDFNEHFLTIVIERPKLELDERIIVRSQNMLDKGLIEECKKLLAQGWSSELKPLKSIGYKEIFAFLQNKINEKKALEDIISNTKKLAKRQKTWFKGQMPWAKVFHPDRYEEIVMEIKKFLGH